MSSTSISRPSSFLTSRMADSLEPASRSKPVFPLEMAAPKPHFSLGKRASLQRPASADKVKKSGKLFFLKVAILAWVSLCFVLTLSATLWMRVYSHFKHKSFAADLEKAQIRSVSESLQIVLSGPNRGMRSKTPVEVTEKALNEGLLQAYKSRTGFVAGAEKKTEAENLVKEVLQIRTMVARIARGETVKGGVAKLREEISAVMSRPFYQLVEREDSAAVNFVQFVAVKLLASDGNEALRNYGRKCLGTLPDQETGVVQLADHMRGHLKQLSFSYGFPHHALFIACHPLTSMHSASSGLDPLNYNASQGNPNFSAHEFALDGKKMKFYYGPGPTGNATFEHGLIPAYEKFGVFELRFNHQDMRNKAESHRVKEILRMGDQHSAVLRHALLGFDTKMQNNKNQPFHDSDSFFDAYRTYVQKGLRGHKSRKEHSGFQISERLLSDAEAKIAIDQAQEFCRVLSANNAHWDKTMKLEGPRGFLNHLRHASHRFKGENEELYHLQHPGKARMAKMMQLITDTYIGLAVIYRSFDAITPEMVQRSLNENLDRDLTAIRTSSACKQNIDRALVENIALRLFFRWTSNPAPLTQDEVYEIVGAVCGRARLVDDRNIMKNRYRILDDLLRFIGHAQGGVDSAHALLKGYRQALKPSSTFSRLFS